MLQKCHAWTLLLYCTYTVNYVYRWESNYIDQAKNTNCTVIGSNLSSYEGTSLKKTEQNSIKQLNIPEVILH